MPASVVNIGAKAPLDYRISTGACTPKIARPDARTETTA
jgi:hypothetical protein